MNYIKEYFTELWSLSAEMAPYLILGFLIAGILHVYLPPNKLKKYLGGSGIRSSINAAIFGIPLPLCSCGVIPTGVSLYKNGASKGSSVSFLISTPQTGIDSILVTYSMLGLPFALIRPVIAFITGVFGGWFTNRTTKGEAEKIPDLNEMSVDKSQGLSFGQKMQKLWNYAFVEFLNDISKWLLIGLLLAALLSVILPGDFFTTYVTNEYLEIGLLLVASIPMYVCATASVPIAAVLIAKGLSPGAALVFLMAGPATNVATIMVIGKSMGRKTLISYLIAIISGAIFFGILLNELDFLRNLFNLRSVTSDTHMHLIPEWIGVVSVVLLSILIINGFIKMKRKASSPIISEPGDEKLNLNVKGMSCSHCEMNVEKNVSGLSGVKIVKASHNNELVELEGSHVDMKLVKKTINDLGYEVVD